MRRAAISSDEPLILIDAHMLYADRAAVSLSSPVEGVGWHEWSGRAVT
jgi:hypothetical protein